MWQWPCCLLSDQLEIQFCIKMKMKIKIKMKIKTKMKIKILEGWQWPRNLFLDQLDPVSHKDKDQKYEDKNKTKDKKYDVDKDKDPGEVAMALPPFIRSTGDSVLHKDAQSKSIKSNPLDFSDPFKIQISLIM